MRTSKVMKTIDKYMKKNGKTGKEYTINIPPGEYMIGFRRVKKVYK
jgi:hypothetical protein